MNKSFVSASVVALSAASLAQADIVFNNVIAPPGGTSPGYNASTSNPNTFMGGRFQLAAGTNRIDSIAVTAGNLTTGAISYLRATVYVWDNINTGTVSSTDPAFSGLLGTYSADFNLTAAPLAASTFNLFEITLGKAGLNIADTLIGITVNLQSSADGVTFSSLQNLTSIVTHGVPAFVGSNPVNGFYRNAGGETNGNFNSGLRSISGLTNQNIGLIIEGVPAPGALALLGVAGLAGSRRRR
jgi:MYXO-CTERM domain-containing protein